MQNHAKPGGVRPSRPGSPADGGGRSREPGLLPQTGAGARVRVSGCGDQPAPATFEQMARDMLGLMDFLE